MAPRWIPRGSDDVRLLEELPVETTIEHRLNCVERDRGREEESLTQVTTQLAQLFELGCGLNSFGHHRHVEFATQRYDGLQQHVVVHVLVGGTDEGSIDFDNRGMQERQIRQR